MSWCCAKVTSAIGTSAISSWNLVKDVEDFELASSKHDHSVLGRCQQVDGASIFSLTNFLIPDPGPRA